MRTLITIVIILAIAIGGAVVYLAATTPDRGEVIRFPLSASHRDLLALVPASAEAFALIPTAAVLHRTLLANPVTSEPLLQWSHEHEMPRPWMLGRADVAAWKSGKRTSYAVRLDPFRAILVRCWLLAASNADARWERSTLIMHEPQREEGFQPATSTLDALEPLLHQLPEGDMFVVQTAETRGAFPPIARPAVTSIRVAGRDIVLVSRAMRDDGAAAAPKAVIPRFPAGAMLAATFASPPRILGDLNRLLGVKIDALVDEGGAVALYDVDTGTLLPRPKGVIAMPADEHARAQLKDVVRIVELVGETRDTGDAILVAFDRTSMGLYTKDTFVPGTWPATGWAVRMNPERLIPTLRKLGDSTGLRLASPRLYRAARDLRRWIDALEHAAAVEAADSTTGAVEELRVRVASK